MRPRVLAQLALMVFCLEGLQAAPLGEQAESTDSASTYTAPSQGGLLELLHQLELLRNQLTSLNGRLEVQAHDLQLMREQQKKIYTDLDSRLAVLEKLAATLTAGNAIQDAAPTAEQGAVSPQLLPELPTSQNQPQSPQAPLPASPEIMASTPSQASVVDEFQMYSAAKDLFDRGQYEEAIAAFQKFVASFPQSSNAAAAQYWIGNAYYAMKRYDEAIAAQKALISQYPNHPKAADAWLNVASSLIAEGKTEEAKRTLRRIIAEYPLSEASEAALARLRTLP
jgi:tol-pal system protein YbgF